MFDATSGDAFQDTFPVLNSKVRSGMATWRGPDPDLHVRLYVLTFGGTLYCFH
jgi:hypothetical protein